MSNSQAAPIHTDNGLDLHGENDSIAAPGNGLPLADLDGVPVVDPIDASSYVAINGNLVIDPESSVRRDTQQAAIAQLQNQNHAPSRIEPEPSQEVVRRVESVQNRSNGGESGTNPAIMKIFKELTKRVESGEKKIEANDKKTDPTKRNLNQMYKYHGTHGHRTEDCRQLREEVAQLLNEGHLREFLSDRAKNHFKNTDSNRQNDQEEPLHVIHMIVRGVDIPQGLVLKCTEVSISREKRTRDYVPEVTLSFNDEDAKGIVQPHNDALVARPTLFNQECRIARLQDQVVPAAQVLNGFNMACETTKGEITLPMNVAGTIQETNFHVIKGDMRYNALFGRP
ncbi:uncharacterized protein [Nicotiana sylvestris]|uniref:uncharacterized protein n=1 Tax=Nicotiana sylvestris TaxID=4096 RepID=UPI00388CAB1C